MEMKKIFDKKCQTVANWIEKNQIYLEKICYFQILSTFSCETRLIKYLLRNLIKFDLSKHEYEKLFSEKMSNCGRRVKLWQAYSAKIKFTSIKLCYFQFLCMYSCETRLIEYFLRNQNCFIGLNMNMKKDFRKKCQTVAGVSNCGKLNGMKIKFTYKKICFFQFLSMYSCWTRLIRYILRN